MAGRFLMILLIFGLVAGIELPGIIKKKQWREFAAYTIFYIFGLAITIAHEIFKVNIAAITEWFVVTFSYTLTLALLA